MHKLMPKHSKINEKEAEKLLEDLNVSKSQLPKILISDPGLPEGCEIGDMVKIERKQSDGDITIYFRVVV